MGIPGYIYPIYGYIYTHASYKITILHMPHFKDCEASSAMIRKRFNLLKLIAIFKFSVMSAYFDIREMTVLPEISIPTHEPEIQPEITTN